MSNQTGIDELKNGMLHIIDTIMDVQKKIKQNNGEYEPDYVYLHPKTKRWGDHMNLTEYAKVKYAKHIPTKTYKKKELGQRWIPVTEVETLMLNEIP